MTRLVFVTTELHPETAGGAGVVIDALARGIAPERACVVLLLTTQPVATTDRPGVELVNRVIPETGFIRRSEAAARAVTDLAEPGDRVEFHDFEGIGYMTLAHRIDLGLDATPITVRFHGPYDLLREVMDTPPPDWEVPAAMEGEAFRMADAVLIPVEAHRQSLAERYELDPERIRLAPPQVPPLATGGRARSSIPVFAVIGRLGEMKGSQDMVAAAVILLEEGHELKVRFIGGDGWSTSTSSTMSDRLGAMIGPEHSSSFEFITDSQRSQLPGLISDVIAVVVPSRFESFCLAAHEARMMGHPVVVPALPAFEDLFSTETGALIYDRTVKGLTDAMRQLVVDSSLVERLASAPAPEPGDPWSAYQTDPEPRHPRSQAGLATAATQRVTSAWEASRSSSRSPALEALYRRVPAGLAKVLKLAPQGLKDRVRAYASWPAELERRARESRLESVARRIASGEFGELDEPDATVVIPVHDDVRFLEETLASVYEQTHSSWEIVIVDDGSTDPETTAFLHGLDRPRVRVIRQANAGLPGARNTGMRMGHGRFLVPLDSDDQLEPEFLSVMIPALEAHPQAGYAHCYARLHHDVDAVWVTRPFNPYWQLLGNGVVGCALLRRQAWEAVGGYDETMSRGNEDWELWLRLMRARWGQVQVPQVLFKYRKHGISMSVDTESRFEEGRRMVRDRHQDLYEPARLRLFKDRWYPMVTVVTDVADSKHEDLEFIADPSALATTWGKYVVDVRGLELVDYSLLVTLAEALEAQPKAARAVTGGLPPVVMVRRWNLHDPGATPDRVIVVDNPIVGPEPVIPSHVARPGWAVPGPLLDMGVPVQRQAPEEQGRLVDASKW